MSAATAALNAAKAGFAGRARARRCPARYRALRVNIADNTLVAPRDGRIEYRVANIGEVLPAGGKVFTMLEPATSTWISTCRP